MKGKTRSKSETRHRHRVLDVFGNKSDRILKRKRWEEFATVIAKFSTRRDHIETGRINVDVW